MAGSTACVVAGPLCSVAGLGSSLSGSLFSGLVSWVAGSSAWGWRELGAFLTTQSSPSVVTGAAGAEYRSLLVLAPLVALCALVGCVLTSLRHGDGAGLVRDVAWAAPALVFLVVTAEPLATLVLTVVNALCAGATATAAGTLTRITTALAAMPSTVPGFAALLFDLAGVVGALFLWFELVLRNAVLSLLLCLSPMVFAAALWSPLRRLAVRLVETFCAVALSKFVVVVALAMGASAIATGSIDVVITGIAVVLLAALTPYTLLRVVPLLETAALHAFDGARQRATAGARRAAATAATGVAMATPAQVPDPPERREDLGLPEWPTVEFPSFPADPDEPPVPPVGKPTVRGGHVAYLHDEHGPVIGWHFDE